MAGLDPTRHQVIYIPNPAFGTRGLYVSIVRALGADPRFHKAEVMAQAADLLAAEEAERHRRVVVAVDEAHLMTPAQLEELRLLTNAQMDSASPFAGILIGQPTLARQLRMGIFAALDQRIATRYHIKPMDLAESVAYLRHHLHLAGRDEPLFADDAVARLHRRPHRRRRRRKGSGRRRLRQEGGGRAQQRLTMTACGDDKVRVGIVLEVEDSPVTLYVWAHLVAATIVDELREHGVVAALVSIDINDISGSVW